MGVKIITLIISTDRITSTIYHSEARIQCVSSVLQIAQFYFPLNFVAIRFAIKQIIPVKYEVINVISLTITMKRIRRNISFTNVYIGKI